MKGVISPGVSAGSNHVGASETWMPQVSCPSGLAALARRGLLAAKPPAVRAKKVRRVRRATSVLLEDDPIPFSAPLSWEPCAECRRAMRRCLIDFQQERLRPHGIVTVAHPPVARGYVPFNVTSS